MNAMANAAVIEPDEQHAIVRTEVCERSTASLEGEKRLMLAVLERAVADFRTYAKIPTGRGRRLFMEVAAWFERSETGPFDFEGICQATELDPDFIRKGLRNAYDPMRVPQCGNILSRRRAERPLIAQIHLDT